MKCDEIVRVKYKAGEKATLKHKNSIIKLAKREIEEYQAVISDAKGQIKDWKVFIKDIENEI